MNLLEHILNKDKDKKEVTGVTGDTKQGQNPCHTGAEAGNPLVTFGNPGNLHRVTKGKISLSLLKNWKTARPWILDHLDELQAKGWTRRTLFQAGKFKYPHGPWGAAFSDNWRTPGVQVTIDEGGAIRWTWTDKAGAKVSQAKYLK